MVNIKGTITWEMAVQTNLTMPANHPDLVVHCKKEKQCMQINVAIPDDKIGMSKTLKICTNIKIWRSKSVVYGEPRPELCLWLRLLEPLRIWQDLVGYNNTSDSPRSIGLVLSLLSLQNSNSFSMIKCFKKHTVVLESSKQFTIFYITA